MDLPGLGTFVLDPSVTIEPDTGKHSKPVNLEGASFESNTSIKESNELIQFISSQTGKIRALAAADLDSHLGLAQQFLNIGKPFLFEGIGSMVKLQSGGFAFTSGLALPALMKDYSVKEISATSPIEESPAEYNSIFARKTKTRWKKPVAVILFLGGLGLAIWGGYTVYKKTTGKKNNDNTVSENKKQESVLVTDTAKYSRQKDTLATQPTTAKPGNYKFILETATMQRALSRFSKLKTFQWNVQMETKDSLSYKIFMLLPATAADTIRILDSLSSLTGKRVYIE